MEPHDLIVLTPPNPADSSLAIAACRAGAVGVLDLEFPPNPDVLATELSRLARHAGNPFGVLLRSEADESLLEQLLAGPVKPHRLIFTGCHPTLPAVWRRAQEAGIEVFLEAVSISEAIHAGALGVAGLILKGHEAAGRVGPDTSFVLIQKWKQQANRTGVT
ncbi:MAG TPA: hypothetical protein VLM40_05485, partial [Gemmata sp.]|nr:hypothetical protein [Gemmata sp.]